MLMIRLSGNWQIGGDFPSPNEVKSKLETETDIQHIAFDTKELTKWDSSLPILSLTKEPVFREKDRY